MARFVNLKTNFTNGEIDPLLRSRVAIDQYPNAAAKLTNVVVQPQGGVKRRNGLRHIYEIDSSYAPEDGVRFVPFEYSVDDSYLLMFTEGKMHVIKNGVVLQSLNGTAYDYVTISGLTSEMLSTMNWAQSADTLILVHPDLPPKRILRGVGDTNWEVSDLVFDSVPKYNYIPREFTPNFDIRPLDVADDFVIFGYFSHHASIVQSTLGSLLIDVVRESTVYPGSTTDDFYNNCPIELTAQAGAGQNRIIIDYDGSTGYATVDYPWDERPSTSGANTQYFIGVSYVRDTAQAGGTSTITLASGSESTDDYYNGMWITIESGTGAGQYGQIIDYVGSTKVATVNVEWDTTPSSDSVYVITPFHESQVGDIINVNRQGRLKIRSVDGYGRATVSALFPLVDQDEIARGEFTLESGFEPAWSDDRGWPTSVTFHEGRLFFGGSKSLPATMWGSKVGLYFDFFSDTGLADDAVESTIGTDQFNSIIDIISGRDLQVFTNGGEFFVPQQTLDPITPANFFIRAASRNGSLTGIKIVQLENGTIYLRRGGKALSEFVYSDSTLSYKSNLLSVLSSHLLKSPTEMAHRKATSTDEADFLFITNGDDGSMAVYSILTQQGVIAPSEFITDGKFVEVAVDVNDVYVVVKRVFDGTDKYFVEKFDSSLFTDCAFTEGSATSPSISFVGSYSDSKSVASSITIPLTSLSGGLASSPSEGDIVLACVSSTTDNVNSNIVCSTSGYTEIADLYANDDYDVNMAAYYKVLSSAETSVTFSGVSSEDGKVQFNVYVFRNVDPTTPLDVSAVTATFTNTGIPNCPAITTSNDNSVVLCFGSGGADNGRIFNLTSPDGVSGFISNRDADSTNVLGSFFRYVADAGEYDPDAFGISSASDQTSMSAAAITIALRKYVPESLSDSTKASGLPHEGKELNVIVDGNVMSNEVVVSGEVVFDRESQSNYEVGLPFNVTVQTLPVEFNPGTGSRIGFKKRIVEVNAILNETQHLNINNILIPVRSFDTIGTLDNPTDSYTGIKTVYGLRGYSKDARVTVTQDVPLKMTLLGLEYKVATHGGS